MRNVVVVGRSGQVAQALADTAWSGARVTCVGRPDFDLTRFDAARAQLEAMAPDVVINAAAYTAVDKAESEPDVAFALNRDAPAVLAHICRALEVPFLHLSTDYVFGGGKGAPYDVEDPPSPRSVYGRSKAAGEDAVRSVHADSTIVRTSWVFSHVGSNFVKTMLRLAKDGRKEIGVVADQHGRPTYAPDLAAACRTIVEAKWRAIPVPPVLHVSNGDEAVWADLAEAVFAGAAARGAPSATVRRISTSEYPTPAPRPEDSRLDTTLFDTTFGEPLRSWRAALDACLDRLLGAEQARPLATD